MLEQKLREYKAHISRLKLYELEEWKLMQQIETSMPSFIKAMQYDDMPGAPVKMFNSSVENTALLRDQAREYNAEIADKLLEISKCKFKHRVAVDEVDALMERLGAEERLIIDKFYFEKMTWRMVAEEYRKTYSDHKDTSSLKRIRNRALSIMQS